MTDEQNQETREHTHVMEGVDKKAGLMQHR